MAMHDLTTFRKPPSNLICLLGLNLKFIPRRRFTTCDLDETLQIFRQQVYLQDYYLNNPNDNDIDETRNTHNPKLHIPTHWVPAVCKIIKDTVFHTNNFTNSVQKLFFRQQCTPNLSLSQLTLLKFLRQKINL